MIPVRYNLRSVFERRAISILTILGIGLVAVIFVILAGFMHGLQSTVIGASDDRNWIVLNRGAPDEDASVIVREELNVIESRPEIATGHGRTPLVSEEILLGMNISQGMRGKQFVTLRGVSLLGYEVHRNMRLVRGHWPERGHSDWVIGQKAAARYPYLASGTTFRAYGRDWNIVGVFSDQGSSRESEIWTDVDDLRAAKGWPGNANSLHVVLNPGSGAAFKAALKRDGRLRQDAIADSDYYAAQTGVVDQLRSLGLLVALAFAAAATLGGMNTMFAAVARRKREIGVLRVLGFSRGSIIGSFIVESAMLGFAGGILGVMLSLPVAWVTGLDTRLMNVGTMLFSYQSSLTADFAGLTAATTVGILGGLLPAWRAARIRIIDSIRE